MKITGVIAMNTGDKFIAALGLIGLLTTTSLFAEIEVQGAGSTVKITNSQGTIVDGPAVVPPTTTETIQKSNDTITQQNPKTSTVEPQADGSTTIKNPDGSSVKTKPDGTQIIKNNDGSAIQKNTDGTQIIKNADGEITQ